MWHEEKTLFIVTFPKTGTVQERLYFLRKGKAQKILIIFEILPLWTLHRVPL